jgi:palmitoyltransferase
MFHLDAPSETHRFFSPIYTLFIPLRIEPYTDGRSWARKQGLDRHPGLIVGEELTDEEEI